MWLEKGSSPSLPLPHASADLSWELLHALGYRFSEKNCVLFFFFFLIEIYWEMPRFFYCSGEELSAGGGLRKSDFVLLYRNTVEYLFLSLSSNLIFWLPYQSLFTGETKWLSTIDVATCTSATAKKLKDLNCFKKFICKFISNEILWVYKVLRDVFSSHQPNCLFSFLFSSFCGRFSRKCMDLFNTITYWTLIKLFTFTTHTNSHLNNATQTGIANMSNGVE